MSRRKHKRQIAMVRERSKRRGEALAGQAQQRLLQATCPTCRAHIKFASPIYAIESYNSKDPVPDAGRPVLTIGCPICGSAAVVRNLHHQASARGQLLVLADQPDDVSDILSLVADLEMLEVDLAGEALADEIERRNPNLGGVTGWLRRHPEVTVPTLVALLVWLFPSPLNHDDPPPPPPAISEHDLRQLLEEIVRTPDVHHPAPKDGENQGQR